MRHETYCRLHEALDAIKTLQVMLIDLPFALAQSERINNSIKEAMEAEKNK